MNQFGTILKFELKGYLKNKVFVGITVFLMAVIAVVMFFPRIMGLFSQDEAQPDASGDRPVLLLATHSGQYDEGLLEAFEAAFPKYQVVMPKIDNPDDPELFRQEIEQGEAECAFMLDGLTDYTYYVKNIVMSDNNTAVADQVLQSLYQVHSLREAGISAEETEKILAAQISHTTESYGKDQIENFFYTYIMIFALYMVILLYGQMVATNVATEKSSRAMEVLITSAKPVSMMFGKVLASCLAGFIQLVCVFGSAFLFFRLNQADWGNNFLINSIFNMPLDLLLYMLLFFVLGFLMYAFMFGAIGSTASKLEDINTSVMPVTLLFIVGFIVVVTSMSGGSIDSPLMVVCSYIPFTSPMAMFTRIAMSTVPFYEVLLSVVILIGSVVGIGFLSAKIYRVGVLLYGTTPKLGAVLKQVWKA